MFNPTEAFHEFIKKNDRLNYVLDSIRECSYEKIWLIGSFLYRGISSVVNGSKPPETDFDFIIKGLNSSIELPRDWEKRENKYGNQKLIYLDGKILVDILPLENFE